MKYILIHDLPTQEEEICIREFYDENDFYSTNIFAVHHIAKRILSIKDLDKRLKAGDIKLVITRGIFILFRLNIVAIIIQMFFQFMITM